MPNKNGAIARLYDGYVVVTRDDGCLVAATRQVFDTFDNAEKEVERMRKVVNARRPYDILCFGKAFALNDWDGYNGSCPDEGCSGGCDHGVCDQCGEDYLEYQQGI